MVIMRKPVLVKIHQSDQSNYIFIDAPPHVLKEINYKFRQHPENYKFMPKFKYGYWDGYIYYFNLTNQVLLKGLLQELTSFLDKVNYQYEIDENVTKPHPLTKEQFKDFILSLNIPPQYKIRDYQFNAAYDQIVNGIGNIECPTNSGKSIIQYLIVRYIISQNKNIIVIVPTINLVEQLFLNFSEYGWTDIDRYTTKITSKYKKNIKYQCVITTWQSIFRQRKENFQRFQGLMIDEAHGVKGNSIQSISEKCSEAEWRIGLTGTYGDPYTCDWLTATGHLGPITKYISNKELVERGFSSKLKIFQLFLHYPDDICKELEKIEKHFTKNVDDKLSLYKHEKTFIESQPIRMKFLVKLVKKLEGNIIVLFANNTFGKTLFNIFNESTNKELFYIDKDVSGKDRLKIQNYLENHSNVILVASYGTMSTGANITNLHHLIFANSYKSKYRIIQSIGRILRIHKSKKVSHVYDLIDVFINKDGKSVSSIFKQYKTRAKLYDKADHTNIKPINIYL